MDGTLAQLLEALFAANVENAQLREKVKKLTEISEELAAAETKKAK